MSQHPIVHVEFSAKNREEAGKFYEELFGWQVEQIPDMNYATFAAEGGPGGGFNPISDEFPAGTVNVYVYTDDIEASLAKAEALGGQTVVPKNEIPQTGWFGFFKDPTGNIVGLYTPMGEQT